MLTSKKKLKVIAINSAVVANSILAAFVFIKMHIDFIYSPPDESLQDVLNNIYRWIGYGIVFCLIIVAIKYLLNKLEEVKHSN